MVLVPKRFRITSVVVLLMGWGALSNQPASAVTLTFTDEDAFLKALAEPLSMESFEGITNTDGGKDSTGVDSISTEDLTVTGIPSEYNAEFGGVLGVPLFPDPEVPTDGRTYLQYDSATTPFEDPGPDYSDDRILRFDFNAPINSFGLNIIDHGDFGGSPLLFSNNAGDETVVTSGDGLLNNNKLFFGIINTSQTFDLVEFLHSTPGEAYAVDEVYYGNSTPVPAPSSTLGLLALGIVGTGLGLKRRRNQAGA